jgi:hypothetical protein
MDALLRPLKEVLWMEFLLWACYCIPFHLTVAYVKRSREMWRRLTHGVPFRKIVVILSLQLLV